MRRTGSSKRAFWSRRISVPVGAGGMIPASPRRWRQARRRSIEHAAVLSRKVWKRHWLETAGDAAHARDLRWPSGGAAFATGCSAARQRMPWHAREGSRRKAMRAGPCGCSQSAWRSWGLSRRQATAQAQSVVRKKPLKPHRSLYRKVPPLRTIPRLSLHCIELGNWH